jgi:hypothetical protein
LLHALTRNAEELTSIAQAEAQPIRQRGSSRMQLNLSTVVLGFGARTSAACASHGVLDRVRKAHVLLELRLCRVAHPEAERLADAFPRLLDRSPVRVATRNRRHARDPGA